MTKKPKGINPVLEQELNKLLAQVCADPEASLTDKMKVIDRVIKFEQVKLKVSDDEWGSGFLQDDTEE